MSETVLSIKHWGNNLGVRLPSAIAKAARLHADQKVRVSVENGRVIIAPVDDRVLSLDERLARFDPEKHGGEVMISQPVGAEHW